jgi:methyl-accepting chemotaxis protein
MSQVDQVTQRNASAAEELASTAEEMAAQAEGLQQLVSHFRLAGHDAGPRPSVPPPAVSHAAPPVRANGAGRGATAVGALSIHSAGQHDRDFKAF